MLRALTGLALGSVSIYLMHHTWYSDPMAWQSERGAFGMTTWLAMVGVAACWFVVVEGEDVFPAVK